MSSFAENLKQKFNNGSDFVSSKISANPKIFGYSAITSTIVLLVIIFILYILYKYYQNRASQVPAEE